MQCLNARKKIFSPSLSTGVKDACDAPVCCIKGKPKERIVVSLTFGIPKNEFGMVTSAMVITMLSLVILNFAKEIEV